MTNRRYLDWVHLDGRSEDVRHDPRYTLAMCRLAHEFIDHQQPACKAELRRLADELALGQRLSEANVRPVMERYGYAPT